MGQAEATQSHDDGRTRVTRWSFATEGDTTGMHEHQFDYIVVPITGGRLSVKNVDGTSSHTEQRAGEPYTGKAGTHHEVSSTGNDPIVFVEIEITTPSV